MMKNKFLRAGRNIIAVALMVGMVCANLPAQHMKAATGEIKNSGLQVFHYAAENRIGLCFASIRDTGTDDETDDFKDWDGAGGNAKEYEVQIAENKAMTKNLKKKTADFKLNADYTCLKDKSFKVSAGKTYYVRARGVFSEDGKKVYSPWSKVQKVDKNRKFASKLKNFKAKKQGNKKVKMSWSKVKKPKGAKKVFYYAEVVSSKGMETDATAKTSITLLGFAGKNYATVIPYAATNNKSEFSNFTNGVCYVGKAMVKKV